MKRIYAWMAAALFVLAGCATPPQGGPGHYEPDQVTALAAAIRNLGPDVDPEEAARAAQIAYSWTAHLAKEYEIEDPPIIHNMKVNSGLKPRGLCKHWAEDMQNRLNAEHFKTLEMHRAIANGYNPIWIDHSTAIISAKGDDMFDGIVLDPWRLGGILTWNKTLEDPKYTWVPQEQVLDYKRSILRSEAIRVRKNG